MELLKNDEVLLDIKKYLNSTDFTNNEIGHRLALSFMDEEVDKLAGDARYSMTLSNSLFDPVTYEETTYGGIIVENVLKLNESLKSNIHMPNRALFEDIGYIQDGRCTKDMISSVLADSVIVSGTKRIDDDSTVINADTLSKALPEFKEEYIQGFLNQLDKHIK